MSVDARDTARAVRAERTGAVRAARTNVLLGVAGVATALVLWEVLTRLGVLPSVAFPRATQVFSRLAQLLGMGEFWGAVWHTLQGTLIGLAAVTVVAIPLGVAIGRVRWIDRSTLVMIELLKPIPPVALLPLALLFYGPTLTMKSLLVFFGALWPLLVQVAYGARGVESTQLDLARSYRFSAWKKLSRIFAPSLLPSILTGLRVSASIAIIIAVVAELIGGAQGIGQEISLAQTAGDLSTMYAYIVVAGLLGLAINGIFVLVGRPVLFWHASHRSQGA